MDTLLQNKFTLVTIRDVYNFIFSNWKNILKAGGLYYIALEACAQLYKIEAASYASKISPPLVFYGDAIAFFLWILASIVIPAIVGTLIFKCLFGERPWPEGFFSFSFGRVERKYSLWMILILFCVLVGFVGLMSILMVAAYFYPRPILSPIIMASIILGIILFAWIMMRLNLIFPALVENVSDTFLKSIKASFRVMKGYTLRFIWVSFCVIFPLSLLSNGVGAGYTFIIFFLPESLGIPLLVLSVILEGILSLFIAAGMFYISFRFYQVRKEAFVQRLQELK